jgi:CRISPR type III-A-associated protein Csm2
MPDQNLVCHRCGHTFVFSEGEQRFYEKKGFQPPKTCHQCREKRKKERTELPAASSSKDPVSLPANYLHEGYFDDQGILRRDIFTHEAWQVALALSNPDLSQPLSSSGLRRFYNRLKAIQQGYQLDKDFENVKVKLYDFLNGVRYAVARKVAPDQFQKFIEVNLELALTNHDAFEAFMQHYESLVAYARNEDKRSPVQWRTMGGLPNGYLEEGYYNHQGYLRREVLLDWPQALVDSFSKQKPMLTSTSLRNFYTKLRSLDTRQKAGRDMAVVLPQIYAFERDAAYAANRKVVPPLFYSFIVRNVDRAINSTEDFVGFQEHFQAVVAFGKGLL